MFLDPRAGAPVGPRAVVTPGMVGIAEDERRMPRRKKRQLIKQPKQVTFVAKQNFPKQVA